MARFIEQGFFARHLRWMRAVYQARHQRIVAALGHRFARHLEIIPSAAGLHLATIAHSACAGELEAVLGRASAAGVELLPLSMYGVDTPAPPGLVLSCGAIPTDRIDQGLDRLGRCFQDQIVLSGCAARSTSATRSPVLMLRPPA